MNPFKPVKDAVEETQNSPDEKSASSGSNSSRGFAETVDEFTTQQREDPSISVAGTTYDPTSRSNWTPPQDKSSTDNSSSSDESSAGPNDYQQEFTELKSELKRRDEAIQSLSGEMNKLGEYLSQQQKQKRSGVMPSMPGMTGSLGSSSSDKDKSGNSPNMGMMMIAAVGAIIAIAIGLGGAN